MSTRVESRDTASRQAARPSPWAWAGLGQASTKLLLLLLATIFASGWMLVDSARKHRHLSRELQELRQQVSRQEEERGRLLIEISTFALSSRIERVAREELHMRVPEAEDIVVVHYGR
ncbi:MAG: cell division protein FtsL [Gammaproteobacteria bacterium]|nr:cell division protein FtsL [Gammaproteobacteria bacterium]